MALRKKRSRRATRKAEAKALRHKAGLEAKYTARNERKHLKKLAKNDAKALTSQQKVDQAHIRTLAAREKAAREGKINAAKVRKYVGIGRVLAPVLVPIAYRAATLLRGQLDQYRAGAGTASGRPTVNVLPIPGSLASATVPPMSSVSWRQMARPSPVPS